MVAQENNFVEKYIKLRHKIMGVSWTDEASKWTLTGRNLATGQEFEDQVDIIIDGSGILNRWKWPDIEGLHDFTGDLLHSANWNQGCDLTDKRVALIGAGSSGVQILPNIYDRVSKVYAWIRNPIWITAGFAQAFAGKGGANFAYTDEQRKLFSDPDAYLAYRKAIEDELNRRFEFIINGSQAQKDARKFSENEMKTLLMKRPDLLDKIMPTNFDVGCRRRECEAFRYSQPAADPVQLHPVTATLKP
jgi:cation diffusion facilitator CzcD-associated flavoprotein CzcO